jgi:hypothetical protein
MNVSPIFGRDFGMTPLQRSMYDHMELMAEQVAQMAEGCFVRGYEPQTDDLFWCYGTLRVPQTDEMVKWLGLTAQDRHIKTDRMLAYIQFKNPPRH